MKEDQTIQPKIAAICGNCKWFARYRDARSNSLTHIGVCHFWPPTLYIGADSLRSSKHPDVTEVDFCGQFKVFALVKTGE